MTTYAGVKVSPMLDAVLSHALEHGFRLEPNPKKKGTIIAYGPDKSARPVHIQERGTNVAHIANITKSLVRAGMPTDCGPVVDVNKNETPQIGYDLAAMLRTAVEAEDHELLIDTLFAVYGQVTDALGLTAYERALLTSMTTEFLRMRAVLGDSGIARASLTQADIDRAAEEMRKVSELADEALAAQATAETRAEKALANLERAAKERDELKVAHAEVLERALAAERDLNAVRRIMSSAS